MISYFDASIECKRTFYLLWRAKILVFIFYCSFYTLKTISFYKSLRYFSWLWNLSKTWFNKIGHIWIWKATFIYKLSQVYWNLKENNPQKIMEYFLIKWVLQIILRCYNIEKENNSFYQYFKWNMFLSM